MCAPGYEWDTHILFRSYAGLTLRRGRRNPGVGQDPGRPCSMHLSLSPLDRCDLTHPYHSHPPLDHYPYRRSQTCYYPLVLAPLNLKPVSVIPPSAGNKIWLSFASRFFPQGKSVQEVDEYPPFFFEHKQKGNFRAE